MFYGDASLAKDVGQGSFSQRMVLWHDGTEGFLSRSSFERDVAPPLAHFDESGALQGPDKALSGDTRQFWHLSCDFDDCPKGLLLGSAVFGAAPGFEVKLNRFTKIRARGLDVFALRCHVEFRAARHVQVAVFCD